MQDSVTKKEEKRSADTSPYQHNVKTDRNFKREMEI